jgi:2'-hydroxyisoflavone reductase
MVTRRQFIAGSVAMAALGATPFSFAAGVRKARRPLRILILGGTGFLGPACTEYALARGHAVTHFNSGRTEESRKQAGRPSLVPSGVEQLFGNRDPEKTADDRKQEAGIKTARDPNSPKGLTQLEGRSWDAVIDTSGYFPRMVRASARLLGPSIRQYVFISSISVYKDTSRPGYDETAPTLTLKDPATEEMGKDFENFGGAKALCEQAAEESIPGKVMVIRPGYIVGPRDTSGRFIYWPVRASLGGEMIVPGQPGDPIQLIDVRDLGEWIVHCIEKRVFGAFNATGPKRELSMKAMVQEVIAGTGSRATPVWRDLAFLRQHSAGDNRFPLYAPPHGETAGFHKCNISRALAKGLKFRPLSITARDTLEWYHGLGEVLQPRVAPQFSTTPGEPSWLEKERQLLSVRSPEK